jgi:predicted permease
MRIADIIRHRLRSLIARRQLDRELDEELRYHLDRQIEQDIARGMNPAAAHRKTSHSLSGITQRKEECRDMRGWNLIDNLRQDLRFALRQLRKNSGFAAAAILMLALGLCASISIFAFVDAALLKPLPYRHTERLVGFYETIPLCPRCDLSWLDYLDWKKLNVVFSTLDVYSSAGARLRTSEGVEQVPGAAVSNGFFRTLGVTPVVGRDFPDDADQHRATGLALLSYSAWQNRYGGRSDILGQAVVLDGSPTTIIGVLPPSFHFAPLGQPEFWRPLDPTGPCFERRSCHNLYGIARLKDGISMETAAANIRSIAQQLEQQYPDSNRGQGSLVMPLADAIVGDLRPILIVLLSGAGLLLLIAAINVAGLLLVRSEGRRREIALRSGLGASRARLACQFLAEAVLLSFAGCAIGMAGARWTMRILLHLIPADTRIFVPYLQSAGFTPRVFVFASAATLLSALVFGAIPASRIRLTNLRSALSEGGRGSAGTVWRRLGGNLVVVELATAVVLLAGAGLLGQSLYRLLHMDLGMAPDHLATLQMAAPSASYDTDAKSVALAREVSRRISALPGVQSVALTSRLPIRGGITRWIRVQGRAYGGEHNEVVVRQVSDNYFATLRARLIRGRYFTEADDASKPPVAIIDQSLARKYFPGEDPVGQSILYSHADDAKPMQIVGVIADIKEGAIDQTTWPALYVALAQAPRIYLSLVIRTTQDEQSVFPEIAAALRQIDRGISTSQFLRMTDIISHSPAAYTRQIAAWLVGGFAALALLLGLVGLYSVIAYSVGQRTREIGVRIALGAQSASVYRLILTQAGRLIALGAALGLAAAVAAASLMTSLLFGVRAWDLATLVSVTALLAVAGMFASWIPARRAAAVNPVDALRSE